MARSTHQNRHGTAAEGGAARLLQQLKETEEPIVLTVNGQAQVVIPDDTSYQRLLALVEQIETIEAIRKGLEDLDAGRTVSLERAWARFRSRHHDDKV
jgi:PHD/YefM family antitoxin component YafN of YafNO toxin-antitoxin module